MLGMFYIRNVTASFVPPLERPPSYLSQALPWFLMLVFLEAVFLRLKGRQWDLSDAAVSSSQGLAQEAVRYTLRGCEGWAYVYIWQHYRWFDVPWDSPVSFWFTMLAVDLGYYWFHRASHEVNLVWASHQVHHSSEYYNLSTALRTVVKSLGPLEHVLNTPSHHRVHHGSNVKYLDKNYAGVLIIWDRLFGTFCWEEETPTYGLVHNIESYNLWTIQLAHFRWIASDVPQQLVRCALALVSLAWLGGQYPAAAVTAGRAVLAGSMLLWLGAVSLGDGKAKAKTQ
ncbi:Alkylglycerol monooxygenase [Amphibalanus amphitrite]|uniref:Alkylglycerol monooxygenase n=1 Tax=Amphibalanus amphitrite TaxID=1232801 RepID=A0A6A4W5Q0_AMPAM|nr:Alkylglycerol monooxygenase [Amphibalanus amphitrite]